VATGCIIDGLRMNQEKISGDLISLFPNETETETGITRIKTVFIRQSVIIKYC
jgi:hypothetical protein